MSAAIADETSLTAEIDRLKIQFPKTRELYREACALLFFRFGQQPTANRLYQLVRRGSMSTPVAVLQEFWADLREKSRVRVEHADLPDDLQDVAGELVAVLWKRATGAAHEALEALRIEVEEGRLAAEASVAATRVDLERTETALEQRTAALLAEQVRVQALEQTQAAAEAARGALEEEIARLQQAGRERDTALAQARADFAAELEKQRASTAQAETRLQATEKRALLEIERERSATARVQHDFAEAQKRAAADAKRTHAEIHLLQGQLGDLRHQAGMLEGQLGALRISHSAQTQELEALRLKAGTAPTAPRVSGRAARGRGAAAGAIKPGRTARKAGTKA
ncbi:chromosome segregation ATPase [Paraburkholderia sp. HC6.4b]|uniref:DNA-binding protein n=1 Tax=unclassified Paraburkholderia TaxID=2615204 RepID=UPI0016070A2F|nr:MULTISPECIES: DNA-binding protein [unclassified Paraburkholderia]MBB5409181.1 chromosome segregation ATPase [Paraburkholderia sp. HC6.4b]MBB5450909.1 chromosome segregation ATPase [Paraburkholderia sp. Kb1A]